ncbi:hypothetical protein LX64_04064 [Chitinophaga skermanii]|uniref:Uncharacterized protein n=1 Tax=Chitinophaga skermanii TaxID=331697 RepID=A0A327Q7T2_9BACT|nr:DUF6263 family protein [Chitinophaga skermanii]RAJ00361.1 hypothetical protein LX64_04064 [Chitinophaga skermanii]
MKYLLTTISLLMIVCLATAQQNAGKVEVRTVLKEGDVYELSYATFTKSITQAFGKNNDELLDLDFVFKVEVKEADTRGRNLLNISLVRLKLVLQDRTALYGFDSEEPNAIIERSSDSTEIHVNTALRNAFGQFMDQTFHGRFLENASIGNITGVDSIWQKIFITSTEKTNYQKEVENIATGLLNNLFFSECMNRVLLPPTQEKVGKNDSWMDVDLVDNHVGLHMQREYTVKEIFKDKFQLVSETNFVNPLPANLHLSYKGKYLVDKASNTVLAGSLLKQIKGQVKNKEYSGPIDATENITFSMIKMN